MTIKRILPLLVLILISTASIAQDLGPEHYDDDGNPIPLRKSGFFTGIYVGSYFPNNHSATLYDGYGFDYEENRNSYENSWMYEKIVNQYGNTDEGHPDYIAEALGVQAGQWIFDESDMPVNMRYKTTFLVGFTGRYTLDPRNAILINVNGAILKAAGNFTITSTVQLPGTTQINSNIKTCNISGEEQRLHIQTGYQHLFGKSESVNFFAEGGLHATLAIFKKSEIMIEDLYINLYDYYYSSVTGYTFDTAPAPVGLGFGAFAGAGVNFSTQSKWDIQFVYNLLLENVRIGYDQKIKPGQSVGLRAYYNLAKKK